MIETVKKITEEIKSDLMTFNEYIFQNPELGYEEHKSSKAHVELLKKHGFRVEENYMGISTAFKAEFDSGKEGPTIAYLSEYDALPGIGHGCGHNILGTASTGAGIVLSKMICEHGGKVIVLGTPGEEIGGSKVDMVEKGVFDPVDFAIAVHPGDKHYKSGTSLAMEALQFTFKGKSAHAAAQPEAGINALDGVLHLFNTVNALRQHIRQDARVHGIIVEGGKAANIVPALAIAQFYVRATTKVYLKELVEKVKNCAKGAALATGAQLEIINYEASYDDLVSNQILSNIYTKRLMDMGVEDIYEAKDSYGSSDMGNVSHVCPTIHPYFSISKQEVIAHTIEFAEATVKPYAYEEMWKVIGAMVLTAIDVAKDQELLGKIRREFLSVDM